MLKKIRCFYWKMRDQGKGRKAKMFAFIFCLALISMVGLVGKCIVSSNCLKQQVHETKDVTTGASISSEGAVSGDSIENKEMHVGTSINAPGVKNIDTSGLDSFLGFMSDAAYASLEQKLVSESQIRQCTSAKKLDYQQTVDGSFTVTSFVLLSDGSVYQCDYNLKSEVVSVRRTYYSETDIQSLSNKEKQTEQEALEKLQKADKKKKTSKKK